jgi:hypothetical protein
MPVLHTDTASLNVFVNTGDFTVYNSLTLLTGSFVLPKSFIHGTFNRLNDSVLVNTGFNNGVFPITTIPGWPLNISAFGHHAEGFRTTIPIISVTTNQYVPRSFIRANHAEGYQTSVEYNACHGEGLRNTVYGTWIHGEGLGNTAIGQTNYGTVVQVIRPAIHVEGSGSAANNIQYAHVEGAGHSTGGGSFVGSQTGQALHVEGFRHRNFGGQGAFYASHVQGAFNRLTNAYASHIEGVSNTGSANRHIHMEGFGNTSGTNNSIRGYHIEGERNVFINGGLGDGTTHIEGYRNTKRDPGGYDNNYVHMQGVSNLVTVEGVSVEGYLSTGSLSGIAAGYGVRTVESTAGFGWQNYITGHFNTSSYYQSFPASPVTASVTYFAIGGGKSNSQRADIFVAYAQRRTPLPSSANTSRQILLPGVLNSGPYANDTAAAAGGVPIGGIYRLSDGIQNNLLQIRLS